MRSLYIYISLGIICLIASCKKDNNTSTVKITAANSGSTVQVTKGTTIVLTLGTATDGGYLVNTPLYDTSILKLNSHNYTFPPGNSVGSSETDTWQFASLKSGITSLKVTESRGTTDTTIEFDGTINVK